jgi:hypothetical protein
MILEAYANPLIVTKANGVEPQACCPKLGQNVCPTEQEIAAALWREPSGRRKAEMRKRLSFRLGVSDIRAGQPDALSRP